MRRDWAEPRRKVDEEGACRFCGRRDRRLEAAHVIPRSVAPGPANQGAVNVVPLCAGDVTGPGCHQRYDAHEISLLGRLTVREEAAAVLVAGGLEAARRVIVGRER